jgi:hypothetical protein
MFQVMRVPVQIQMNPGVIQKRGLKIRDINFFGFVMSDNEDPFSRATRTTGNIVKRLSRPRKLGIAVL